jgi:hypothetical protein
MAYYISKILADRIDNRVISMGSVPKPVLRQAKVHLIDGEGTTLFSLSASLWTQVRSGGARITYRDTDLTEWLRAMPEAEEEEDTKK